MSAQGPAIGGSVEGGLLSDDAVHLEYLLADSRLLLAGCVALLASLGPGLPPVSRVAFSIPLFYIAFAVIVWAMMRHSSRAILEWTALVHMLDVSTAAAMLVLPGAADGLGDALCLFTVLGAALRWGLFPALLTAFAIVLCYLANSTIQISRSSLGFATLPTRPPFLLLSAFVVALIGGAQGTLRHEDHVLARVLTRVKRGDRFTDTLAYLLQECLEYLHAERAVLAMLDDEGGRLYLWRSRLGQPDGALTLVQVPVAEAGDYFFDMPPVAGSCGRG